ncbi:MAG TPA: chemotaxis protein, partial [Gammaproteobacteria bacterium]|nr:chemotaxis protein [Gammaproteobacteria bacterium]
WKDSQYRLAETAETNRRNQHAILKLLDEMSSLADGDLSSYATVTEDVTGAIADSVNYAIDALRDLVATINRTSVHISDAAQTTQRTAEKLTKASGTQKQEILSATQAIAEMANSMNTVSEEAESSVEVAKNSLDIAAKGAQTVQDNIKAMDLVREQIQDTSKRIKRLGESSQEIGDIIGVINEISDRTNILALNAAIQASTAGEAGRGFAVVADEVQRLAERTGDAAKQVEALVKAIQTDTNEAISSMEHTTTGVVKGAQLTETAGGALSEIERVSNQLAGLIQGISLNAQEQSKVASSLANVMQVISDITEQTTAGTQETNDSIGNLAILAEELKESVSDFKLPESEETPVFDERPIPVETANGAKKQSDENVVFQIATEK